MSDITMHSIISRNSQITAADMDGEIVMMNIENGNYYNLGKTGSTIWNMLQEPITLQALMEQLLDRYDVTRKQCEDDTLSFLQQLWKAGLIVIE